VGFKSVFQEKGQALHNCGDFGDSQGGDFEDSGHVQGELEFMLKISLLNKVSENGKDIYRATMKGMDFLQRYHEIVELLKTEENNGRNNNIRIPPPHLLKRN
jgi:predicted MarR family transcription regulator